MVHSQRHVSLCSSSQAMRAESEGDMSSGRVAPGKGPHWRLPGWGMQSLGTFNPGAGGGVEWGRPVVAPVSPESPRLKPSRLWRWLVVACGFVIGHGQGRPVLFPPCAELSHIRCTFPRSVQSFCWVLRVQVTPHADLGLHRRMSLV